MFSFVNALLGAIVWLVANVVYVDLRRKGIRGFTRFAAFWVGTPTTWISLFAVRERPQETFSVEDDGGERLLEEIRRDRALRPGERPMDDEGHVTDSPLDASPDRDPEGNVGGGGEDGEEGHVPLARGRTE